MASVILSVEPKTLEPLNADVWYKTISGSSSVSNFKYIFNPLYKVEPFSTSSYNKLSVYKVPPRPVTGEGLFSPNRILKSYFENYVNPFQTGWISNFISGKAGIPGALIDYKTEYGFEYNPGLVWADTYNTSGMLGLTFSYQHGLISGDLLILDKDNKTLNVSYDGTCSVTSVINNYHIKTDKSWGINTNDETGTIISLRRLSATSSDRFGYNGTKQYNEINKDFTTEYILGTSLSKFLTNYNQTYKYVGIDDYETISMILDTTNLTGINMIINTYDSNNNNLNVYTYPINVNNLYRRVDFGVGPKNLINAGVILKNVDYYTIRVNKSSNISELKYYKIDNKCSSYDNVRVLFLNRAGGWDYFNFKMDSKRNININRTEYERILNYNYRLGDRGRSILSQDVDINMTITSDWITEKDSIWLEELITSPEVYILGNDDVLGGSSTGYKLPILITDTNYEVKTYMRNQVFNLVVNFKYSYKLNLQNQ